MVHKSVLSYKVLSVLYNKVLLF
ncbi:hypothetical protein GMOD_00010375 [Pyrenophora seminiperda CCB06]|uniref:Uncharacterized protein n=1 Tax=Pyrenophora seminiperda CCB06 TaxID=1302712 RepID=A0A3M7M5E9_9PLEO|nr:hypothetical protein GMOD_00010375 [Pyrenophora seminiperda CCB06]